MSIMQVERVLNHSQTRGPARTVLLVIAYHAHDDGSGSHPGLDRIAQESGFGRATVARSVPRIEALGEMRVHRGGGGAGDTNAYTVTISHAPGSASPCDASCRRQGSHSATLPTKRGSHRVATRVSESRDKGLTESQEEVHSATRTVRNRQGTVNEPPARAHSRARASRRSADRPKAPPDPRIRLLLDLFCTTHAETLGQPYLVRGCRDGQHLKDALRTYDEPTIRRALDAYFVDRPARLRFGAPSVPQFVAQIATLAVRTPPAPAVRNFTAERWAEEEAAERAAAAGGATTEGQKG